MKIIPIFLMLLLPLVASAAKPLTTSELEIKLSEQPISAQIDYFADLYGTDASVVKKVVECESDGYHGAVGDSGLSRGIAQFQKETFTRMSKLLGEKLDYNSSYDQIKLLSFAMSKPELAREWTSWRALQNNGKYSFYSKQLGKHFTVYCR